ncbi:uncharacterized protein FPRO_05174 [Fusarium proliferatum ET1]|uniref:N-acetyltransferase domain-containing protein n=1 Tax=Fusarium proliferatum (strain ET1) TaxID=1227346 RepID=A0A1L7VIL6_FUSPR|nr:uncharacterized protein FPRO_05174 [Fusarium proliferatum ET1]CZR40274.1 uncharacterized protein FPRO_05174 [Fusarium proliferatum ET1]
MEPNKPALKIVRISSREQLEELVDFICDAFMEDDLFCAMVPGRHEHPEAARSMWRMTLVEEYGRKGSVLLAARLQGENGEVGDFVACAVWCRCGNSDLARSWQGDNWNKRIARIEAACTMFYCFSLRQAGPGIALDACIAAGAAAEQAYKFYPDERWRLSLLATSPKCQRTGIGKRLVQWGLDRCEEEGVPATLESSVSGRPLYEKMGFREVGIVSFYEGKWSMPAMLRPVEEDKKTV